MSSGSPDTLSSSSTEPGPSRRMSAIFMLRRPISTVTSMGTSITKPRPSSGLAWPPPATAASGPVCGSSDFKGLVGSSGRVIGTLLLGSSYSSSVPRSDLDRELSAGHDGDARELFHTSDANADRVVGRRREPDHVSHLERANTSHADRHPAQLGDDVER